jgi:hypothetical protein
MHQTLTVASTTGPVPRCSGIHELWSNARGAVRSKVRVGLNVTYYPRGGTFMMAVKNGRKGLLLAILCLIFVSAVFPITAQATDYYVNAGTGDNGNGGLSPGDAWKTITYALSQVSGTGHTIYVAAGSYDTTDNGETFPLSMKNGVSLQGDGAATTILDAESAAGIGVISASAIGSATTLDGFTITNGNESGYVGGGINSVTCSWTVSNCIIDANYTSGFGGGINCESTDTTTFINCTISDNSSSGGGGVECYYRSAPTFINCVFSNNSASSGGAIMVESSGTGYGFPKLINCTITNNSVTSRGGAFYGYSGSAKFTNCTITNNSASIGSAFAGINSAATVVVNSVIWGNTGATYEIQRGSTSWPFSISDLSYSNFNPSNIEPAVSWSGSNNINSDPLFVGGGDYHLQGTPTPSPCIDAGTDDDVTYPDIPSDDRDGDSRPQGTGYDMGSDEYVAAGPTCVDNDGDGYGVCPDCGTANGCDYDGDDCDDTDEFINPGATEITCNGVDDDCNAATLDAPDADIDTYDVCNPSDPGDTDGRDADCNDSDDTINPGATDEPCDGIDQDCSGADNCDAPDVPGHNIHTADPADPRMGQTLDCDDCHGSGYYTLSEMVTDGVCDPCHSPGGAFDGVNDATIGVAANWAEGVYEADGETLKVGKEQWCAGCHDDEPAYSQPCDPEAEGGAEAVEVVVDNSDATYAGSWGLITGNACAYTTDFQWNAAGSGADTATWTPNLPQAGDYKVYARWVAHSNRATDAPYTITYDGGSTTIDVDQTTAGCAWNLLGTYPFAAGPASIVLSDDADGYLIADAVKLTLVNPADMVLDNSEATYAGTWPVITGNACAYGEDFQWNEAGSGIDTATWTPNISAAGDYSVYARWVAHANRATDAPYTITYNGGSVTIDVDQTTAGCQWNLLGTYLFAAGTGGSIVLSDDANGYLIADGIRLVSAASCPPGASAPNVIGDDTTYGFFVSGHKISCLSCHDADKDHIDHQLRTYASASDNYQAGYRLRSVGALEPMNIPRPKSTGDAHDYVDDFALCFDCHNANELIGESDESDASKTNFDYSSGQNGHYNHLAMGRVTFDSDFDGLGDSEYSCTACHNVHGSSTPAMTRDGALILETRDDLPPDFGALNFSYLPAGATVVTSVAGKIELAGGGVTQNGICAATCHGSGATVYRTAYFAPRVLSCPEIDAVFNDDVDTTLLTAYVLDHNAVTVPNVTIDVGPLGGSTETMNPIGNNIYAFETTVPDTVGAGVASLDVTATDGDGTGTNEVDVTVIDPEELILDNEDAVYAGSWPLVTGNACAYEEDFQWNAAGTGADTATWTPTVYQAGDYNVYARWVNNANRATDAPYTITYDGGSVTIDKNQQTDGCTWNLLGTYPFVEGTTGSIVLSDDANGYLSADAVRLELVP